MTSFEYISVLFSIILGLGITQLVSGVADIIQQWERVKIYWPHILWIGFIFFLHIQAWWQFYDLQKYEEWRLNDFMLAMVYLLCYSCLRDYFFQTISLQVRSIFKTSIFRTSESSLSGR